jgi:peroxiredoxin
MLPLGTIAPDFRLLDARGTAVGLTDTVGPHGVLVMFICNHCPYVKHVATKLSELTKLFAKKGVGVVAVNSNDVKLYPADSPENMLTEAALHDWRFPYLLDSTQEVAKAYQAACTPDFFLFDRDRRLFYRGQMDSSRPSNGVPVTGSDLVHAVDELLAGRAAPTVQVPSLGCNIKWTPGNEPQYFPHA